MDLNRRARSICTAAVATAAVLITSSGVAHAGDGDRVTVSETVSALADVPGVLADSDGVTTTSDADSAAISTVAGIVVDIPKDAGDGILLSDDEGPDVTITPALAAASGTGVSVEAGVVAYPGTDGAATAVQATEDGGARLLTVIAGTESPDTYTYEIEVPSGGSVQLTQDGGAEVQDSTGAAVVVIDQPWAQDANGVTVPTHYTTDGTSLVQHVAIDTPGIVFPVTADPWVHRWYGWDLLFNRNQTNNIMFGLAGAAVASLWIPDPTVTKIATAALGLLAGYANWVYNRNGCVKLRVTYTGGTIPGHYYGGSCR